MQKTRLGNETVDEKEETTTVFHAFGNVPFHSFEIILPYFLLVFAKYVVSVIFIKFATAKI